jgi:hypothetical protein
VGEGQVGIANKTNSLIFGSNNRNVSSHAFNGMLDLTLLKPSTWLLEKRKRESLLVTYPSEQLRSVNHNVFAITVVLTSGPLRISFHLNVNTRLQLQELEHLVNLSLCVILNWKTSENSRIEGMQR